MHNACNKFRELKNAKKKQEKIDLLTKFSTDTLFCYLIEFLLNNNKIIGISTSKLNKQLDADKYEIEHEWNDLPEMIDYLLENPTGTNQTVFEIQNFLNNIEDKEDKELIIQILTKKYKCGVTDLTAYGYIPGLERNWRCRKGYPYKTIKDLKESDIILSLKYDGYRVAVIKYNNHKLDIITSNGLSLDGLVEVQADFYNKTIPPGVYDCECVAIGDFIDSTERFKATSKILSKKGLKRGVKMCCFDYIEDIDAFNNFEKVDIPCIDRKNKARQIIKNSLTHGFIEYADHKLIKYNNNIENTIFKHYYNAINRGEEGIMIDIADAPYERARGKTIFKLKAELEGDFLVTGLNEGVGELEGTLGSFTIDYKGYSVNIGTGMSDELRDQIWADPSNYINKLIEVRYFGESRNKEGELSMRNASFKRLRHDKSPTDVNY